MIVLLIIQTFIALALIGVILIQKTDSAGLGLGSGGGGGSVFTARGAANFLTRATAFLAAVFMANCLFMSILSARQIKNDSSIIRQSVQEKEAPSPVENSTEAPAQGTSEPTAGGK